MDIDGTAGQTRVVQLNPVEEPLDLDQARRTLTSRFPLVNDHPDVAGVLRDGELLALTGRALAEPFRGRDIDHVIAPEARGPILGALVARELGAGLVLARKDDRNHPGADIPVRSEPTWRGHPEVFQGRSFDLSPGERVVIVDDWITTGSTLKAARSIVQVLGGEYAGAAVLMNKAAPTTIDALDVHWLVDFEELVPHG